MTAAAPALNIDPARVRVLAWAIKKWEPHLEHIRRDCEGDAELFDHFLLSRATDWAELWTQDHDGTLRFQWEEREGVQEVHQELIGDWNDGELRHLSTHPESQHARHCAIALEAFDDPAAVKLLKDFAPMKSHAEYEKEQYPDNVTPIRPQVKPQYKNEASERASKMLNALMADNDKELRAQSKIPYLIDGLFPSAALTMLYGPSQTFKSFVALDMAACIATGKEYAGHDIGDPGAVVYIAAEGGGGMRKRLRAWEQYNGIRALGVRILPMPVVMDNAEDRRLLRLSIEEMRKRLGESLKLIVVDTLSQTAEGDDNSNRDMATYIRGCAELKDHFGCTVAFVHHTGKSDKSPRGAYSLQANLDAWYEITSDAPGFTSLNPGKLKDDELPGAKRFRLEPVELDGFADYKGRALTSLVPRPLGLMEECDLLSSLSPREEIFMDALEAQTNSGGHPACDRTTLRDDYVEALTKAEPGITTGGARKAFTRALESCGKRGLIKYTKTEVTKIA